MTDNYGVFITRAQPFHKGHLMLVKKILNDNDKCLIIMGSANKQGTIRNPFDSKTREKIMTIELNDEGLDSDNRVSILKLPDWSMEDAQHYAKEWGSYLYYNIVAAIRQKTFNLYYNDSLSIINTWFNDEIAKRVNIISFDRNMPENRFSDISSTKIRDAIINLDKEYLKKALTANAVDMVLLLKDDLIKILQNPGRDFIMN